MSFVWSTKAHANIVSVDNEQALASPGVRSYVDVKDVPGSNLWGPLAPDEPLFADGKVNNIHVLVKFKGRRFGRDRSSGVTAVWIRQVR